MSLNLVVKNCQLLSRICPIEKIYQYKDNCTVVIKSSQLINSLILLKYHIFYQYNILGSISGVDFPNKKHRFSLIYELLSIRHNYRLKVKVYINELTIVDSCSNLFLSGGWYECEIWDMFGVFFKNHGNLKRILTDYGFEGYPLRKDFPLSGFIELKYNEIEKRVIYEPIELEQEYRTLKFLTPWVYNS